VKISKLKTTIFLKFREQTVAKVLSVAEEKKQKE
jgi:hypothetical protein